MMLLQLTSSILQFSWSLPRLCSLSLVPIIVLRCWPGFDKYRFGVCEGLQCSVLNDLLLGFRGFLVLLGFASRICF